MSARRMAAAAAGLLAAARSHARPPLAARAAAAGCSGRPPWPDRTVTPCAGAHWQGRGRRWAGTAGGGDGTPAPAATPSAADDLVSSSGGPPSPSLHSPEASPLPPPHPLDYTTMSACARALAVVATPAKVDEVVQADRYTLALRVRTEGEGGDLETAWMHVCWHPHAARVTLGPPPARGSTAEAYSLGAQVSSLLQGLVLTSVDVPVRWERMVELQFAPGTSERATHALLLEVVGAHSNLLVVSVSGDRRRGDRPRYGYVLAAARQVGEAMSRTRRVAAGQRYVPMAASQALAPNLSEGAGLWRANLVAGMQQAGPAAQPGVAACLGRTYRGVGRAVAAELCAAAGVPPDAALMSLDNAQWAALAEAWRRWLCAVLHGRYALAPGVGAQPWSVVAAALADACVAEGVAQGGGLVEGGGMAEGEGFAQGGGVAEGEGGDKSESEGGEGFPKDFDRENDEGCMEPAAARALLAAVDGYYRQLQDDDGSRRLRAGVLAAAARALRRACDKLGNLRAQLGKADDAVRVAHTADLITANMHAIPPRAESVEVEDWETGEMVTLALDPTVPPADAVAALYKRARKLRRTADAVTPHMEQAQREADYLEGVVARAPSASADELRAVADELVAWGFMPRPADAGLEDKAHAKARKAAKKGGDRGGVDGGFRAFTSPSGLTVLVGRNNRENDELSTRVAAPGDVWLHARGVPGSHTVLRVPGGGAVADEDVRFAATLAAYFSKARLAGVADVTHTRAKHVKKPRGAKPGLVTLMAEQVVRVRPDDAEAVVAEAAAAAAGAAAAA